MEFTSILDFLTAMEKVGQNRVWIAEREFKVPIALALANRRQEAIDVVEDCYRDMRKYRVNRNAYPMFYEAFMTWVRA
jgi:hypothetical protein